ncbi:MAG: glycosyltransferase family 4 protein [Chloroflexota bacterium]
MDGLNLQLAELAPVSIPSWMSAAGVRLGLDLSAVAANYPAVVRKHRASTRVIHFSHQQMGMAMLHRDLLGIGRKRGPVVVTVHDLFPLVSRRDRALADIALDSSGPEAFLYRLGLVGLKRADMLLCDSQHTARDANRYLGVPWERVRVVYPGGPPPRSLDPAAATDAGEVVRRDLGIPESDRIVLYVGSQLARKNLATLIAAVREVSSSGNPATLVIAGSSRAPGSASAALDSSARGLKIRFTGHVDDQRLEQLFAAANLLAFPSRFEGFGFPPLEAMAQGCPVVASDATSIPEVVGDAGILVPPTDIRAWAAALRAVLSDEALRSSMREKGLRRASQFTWAKAAQETAAVYRELAEMTRGKRR